MTSVNRENGLEFMSSRAFGLRTSASTLVSGVFTIHGIETPDDDIEVRLVAGDVSSVKPINEGEHAVLKSDI